MQKLDDRTVVQIIREEWNIRKEMLVEEAKKPFMTASPGLKLKYIESGTLYTVVKVAPGVVTIKSPEGELSRVSNDDLEKGFELG